ncbi:hypothetical protein DCAR_0102604 [Daucus carota subsp. sativus]|uniref:GATA-type domain-containing protein n=1 Tax=Daucus carota subsp. sativus TaxID=79200 RepID=A0A162B4C0_DAUCS|nr:PREDICTED: GATA transcription factor 16 [Daucus carota subsp. sativus]WOG83429.1 hypothetical protein DCAR_0102604 [Daucus carota subsp. sativus]
MVDRNERGSNSDEISSRTPVRIPTTGTLILPAKTCWDCETTRTPLWRTGPSGPKSLCNACGIRFGKLRKELELLGLVSPKVVRKRNSTKSSSLNMSTVTSDRSSGNNNVGEAFNKPADLGGSGNGELVSENLRSRLFEAASVVQGEMEQAALILMAMSCD